MKTEGFSTFISYYLLKAATKQDMVETISVLEEYYGAMLKLGAAAPIPYRIILVVCKRLENGEIYNEWTALEESEVVLEK